MRTTLSIDDDVFLAVRERARREGRSIGDVLSQLAREALARSPEREEGFRGFKPFPRRGPAVSNALIDRLRGDDDA